jgi:diguanylate cyclase (GGDEF)-like protein
VLSGLYNRAYFEEEMYRLEKGRQFPISIVTLKLNDLQAVNERDGIAAGNELLKHTAKVLKAFRTEDIVARIGGDRFAALLPFTNPSLGKTIVKRLKDALEAHNKHCKGMPLELSFGIATGEKGSFLSDILKTAEAEMN